MDVAAKVTSKGQVTVPKVVRDALGIQAGDEIVFRVEGFKSGHRANSKLPGPRRLDTGAVDEAECGLG